MITVVFCRYITDIPIKVCTGKRAGQRLQRAGIDMQAAAAGMDEAPHNNIIYVIIYIYVII